MKAVNRRDFIRVSAAGAAASAVAPIVLAEEDKRATPDTLVANLYKSLNDQQRQMICLPFDHKLRSEVSNNWRINKSRVSQHFTDDQQAMINDIFRGLHSEEYAEKVVRQVETDGGGRNLAGCSVAIFGEPGTGKFEFVLTGRHCTRRCDGDSVDGVAFGGPIFYGHAADGFNEGPDHKGNAYWFQALRANELYQALDGKQQKIGLVQERPRSEGETRRFILSNQFRQERPGIPVGELSTDQKGLARQVMSDLLAPFRKADRAESMKLVEAQGFDNLHFAWFTHGDIGDDKIWDVWQIEGPSMLWLFRGTPHVHTWVHIRKPA